MFPHPSPPPLVEGVKTLLSGSGGFNSSSQRGEVERGGKLAPAYLATCLPVCTSCMAEAIKPDTSVMLLGTMRVVLDSVATFE